MKRWGLMVAMVLAAGALLAAEDEAGQFSAARHQEIQELSKQTRPPAEQIEEEVEADAAFRDNLLLHSPGCPAADRLKSLVKTGNARYGMADVGDGKSSEGSNHLTNVVDRNDSRPVWICVWDGANTDTFRSLDYLQEGDSPTFLYCLPTGLNNPDEPTWGLGRPVQGPSPKEPGGFPAPVDTEKHSEYFIDAAKTYDPDGNSLFSIGGAPRNPGPIARTLHWYRLIPLT